MSYNSLSCGCGDTELSNTREIISIEERLKNLRAGGGYDIFPDPDGLDQTAEIKALFTDGRYLLAAPGTYYFGPSAETYGLFIKGIDRARLNWNGSTLIYRHNFDDFDDCIGMVNTTDVAMENVTLDVSPRITTQGLCTAVTSSYFEFRVEPGFEFVFRSADFYGSYLPGEDNALDQHRYEIEKDDDNIRTVTPFPIEDMGGGIFRCSPSAATATVTGIATVNPLTLSVSSNGVNDGTPSSITGITGTLSSLIPNGTDVFTYDQGDGTILITNIDGETYDATGLTCTGATLTDPAVREWLAAGEYLYLLWKKRAGNMVTRIRTVRSGFRDTWVKSSGAVAFVGMANEDSVLDRLTIKGDGAIGCNAGGIAEQDHRGEYFADYLRMYGISDDGINFRARLPDFATTVTGARTMMFPALPDTQDTMGNVPTRWRAGDIVEFWNPDTEIVAEIAVASVVGAASTITVTMASDFPSGYVPSKKGVPGWMTVNRTANGGGTIGEFTVEGGATRALLAQTKWRIGTMNANGLHGNPIFYPFPTAPQHLGQGGAKDLVQIGLAYFFNNHFGYRRSKAGLISTMIRTSAGLPVDGVRSDIKGVQIGTLIADNYGYAATASVGAPVTIGTRILRNGGQRRDEVPSGQAGNFDDFAGYGGGVYVGTDMPYEGYGALEENGGEIYINGDRVAEDGW